MTDVQENDAGVADTGKTAGEVAGKGATEAVAKDTKAAADTTAKDGAGKGGKGASIATGAEATTSAPPDFPTDWRERMAKDAVGDDAKGYDKELKRLQRYASPSAVWQKAAELEAKLGQGGLVKIPGPKASDEEKAAYAKARGVPEKPEDYFGQLKLGDGIALGEADRPVFDSFAQAMHAAGAAPAEVSAGAAWFLKYQQAQAEAREEADDDFQRSSETALRKEWGGSFKAHTTAVATLIADAPPEVRDFFAAGRSTDGRKVGNDPVMLRWLTELALEKYPADQHRDGGTTAQGDRLEEIRRLTREGKSTPEMEKEQTELIAAQQASQKRGRRAA